MGGAHCNDLAQDMNKWRTLVEKVMKLAGFTKFWEFFE